MDPDAKVQVATLGTALYYRPATTDNTNFIGSNGSYNPDDLMKALSAEGCVRIYGLASTPDFGGQPLQKAASRSGSETILPLLYCLVQ